jgi:hypothetical protein
LPRHSKPSRREACRVKTKVDRDPDNGPANNNNGEHEKRGDIVPSPEKGALASLTALGATLNAVDTSSVAGRSGLPMMLFKSRDNNGTWTYGQKRTIPEADRLWAVNPETFRWGYISFGDGNKVLGERLVPIDKPKPDVTQLPDTGFE